MYVYIFCELSQKIQQLSWTRTLDSSKENSERYLKVTIKQRLVYTKGKGTILKSVAIMMQTPMIGFVVVMPEGEVPGVPKSNLSPRYLLPRRRIFCL